MLQQIQKFIFRIGPAIGVLSLFLFPQVASADDDCEVGPIILEVPFNSVTTSKGLPDYIANIYEFLVLAAIVAAVVMIMFSGLKWASAAGNASMVSDSKERIKNAFFGLAIALASYMILYLVNPNLVTLPGICPTGLDFAQQYGNWIQCADREDESCNDVQYCNYSDTIDNECTCDNIGSAEGSYYVCRPNVDGIVPVEGVCKNTANCVDLTGIDCVGNDSDEPGICMASTEGEVCVPDALVEPCSPGETCTEEKYTGGTNNGWFCMSDTSREVGEYCTSDAQCASEICDSASSNLCMDGSEGSVCRNDSDCSTGHQCESSACREKEIGDGCDTTADCQNTSNPDNYCVTDLVGPVGWNGKCTAGSVGDTCDGPEDCASTSPYCVDTWGDNECNDGSKGADCRDGSECSSGSCSGATYGRVGSCD